MCLLQGLMFNFFKDRRKYAQFYMSSENFTEYLGQSDSAGRVKVYNKRLESGLIMILPELR